MVTVERKGRHRYYSLACHEVADALEALEALAASMGQERDTLEDVVEPYLLQVGFIIRTRQGRQATREAHEHLGLPYTPPHQPDGKTATEQTLF